MKTFYVLSSVFAFIASIAISTVVLFKGHDKTKARAFAYIALMAGVWSLFPFATAFFSSGQEKLLAARLVYLSAILTGPAFVYFGIVVAGVNRDLWAKKFVIFCHLVSLLFVPLLFTDYFIKGVTSDHPYSVLVPGRLFPLFIVMFFLLCFYSFVRIFLVLLSSRGEVKNALKYIFIAYLMAFFSALIHFGSAYGLPEFFPHDLLVVTCMICLGYAVIRYRLMDIRVAVTSFGLFIAVYSVVLGLPFGLAIYGREGLISLLGEGWFWPPMLSMLCLATTGPFLYLRLQRRAEDELLKEEHHYQQILIQASNTFADKIALEDIISSIVDIIDRTIQPRSTVFYIFDSKKYVLKDAAGDKTGYASELPVENPLVAYLKTFGVAYLGEIREQGQGTPQKKVPDRETAALFSGHPAVVAVPFRRMDAMLGILFLGEKKNAEIYSERDLLVLKDVAINGAMAIVNAIHIAQTARSIEEEMHDLRLRDMGAIGASISHQVGNRLQLVIRFLEVLRIRFKPEKLLPLTKEEVVHRLGQSMEMFPEVIDNAIKAAEISDALRIQGKMSKDAQPVPLKQLVRMARAIAEAKHPAFRYEFLEDYDESLTLWVNEASMQDILFNLFDNSLDAVRIRMETMPFSEGDLPRVKVTARVQEDMAVIQIVDNGIGFRPEALARAFTPYHTTKGSGKGTGLGLYIIHQFIRHSQGAISLDSKFGEWTKFTLTLPLATPQRMRAAEEGKVV
jgi:signal transduction histidine kinase